MNIAELRRLEAEADNVKRYTPSVERTLSGMTERPEGDYVRYADYLAMRNALKALEEAQAGDLNQILHDPENQPSQYGTVPYELLLTVRKILEEIATSGDYGTTGDGHSDCVGLAMDALALIPPHGGVDVG